MQLSKRNMGKEKFADKEYAASNYIPYECHWDDHTIVLKSGHLMQIVRLDGYSFETADDDELDLKKSVRNTLFKSMVQGDFALWFHTIRRREGAYPQGEMPDPFSRLIDDMWRERHQGQKAFKNELYISIITKPDTKGLAKINHWINWLTQKTDKFAKQISLKESFKEMEEITDRIVSTCREYGARRLRVVERPNGVFCEMMEFLGMLVNGGYHQPIRFATHSIDKHLPTHRLYFGKRAIEIRGATKTRYGGIVSLKEYGSETATGMLDSYLKLPFEFIMCQSFVFTNRQTSIERMRRDQNRMINANDPAISQIAEINDALDVAMSGVAGFGTHHLSWFVIEDDVKSLEKALSMTVSEMINVGNQAVVEKMNMEPCFWSMLPGNYEFVARKAEINTLNLAGYASMHNYPVGRVGDNHWGDAVTVLDTSSGTPYFFNFHVHDVGHTTIIGPTGAGKTVLMCFLVSQAQKFNARTFVFDKDRGADIFVRSIGGVYNVIEIQNKNKFNPLKLADTAENRTFLYEWFRAMITASGEDLTAQDIERINEAINGNYKLNSKDRRLRNVAPFFGLQGPGTIGSRIALWYNNGPYAGLFDNENDGLDFDDARVFGFEMGEVLMSQDTLGPVLLYLFHKISLSLDGTPTMIVLDEAWALVDNPIFSGKIKDWLKTMRKLNAMVVFATQSVEDASKSKINDTLLQQTATQIFLPNMKATDEYRKAFLLSQREFEIIKTTDPSTRYFVLKQAGDVVVAKLDLQGLEEIIPVLSGRAETVRLCDQIRAEVGEDPSDWLPVFMERVKEYST